MSLAQVAALADAGRPLVDFDRSSAAPLEQQVLDAARPTKSSVLGALDQASNLSAAASNAAAGTYARQVRGLGGNSSATENRAAQRRIGLSRALLDVDARNRAVSGVRQRTDIARSAAGDLRSIVEGAGFGALGSAANMAADRETTYQQELAKYKQDKAAGLGQLVSLGTMFIPGVGPLIAGATGGAR